MAIKYRLLSYPLNIKTPLYGDTGPLKIKAARQIKKNDSCNTFELSFINHSGTHIDAPKHFYNKGRSVSEYSIREFIFNCPYLISCPKAEDELILSKDIKFIPRECDMLLLKTGFYKYRNSEKYKKHNPGISLEAAKWLRSNYPFIRALGIDTISFSAFQNRGVGRKAHEILLKEDDLSGNALFLIEDLNLSGRFNNLKKVYAIPFFVEGIDSSPCTVFAELKLQSFK